MNGPALEASSTSTTSAMPSSTIPTLASGTSLNQERTISGSRDASTLQCGTSLRIGFLVPDQQGTTRKPAVGVLQGSSGGARPDAPVRAFGSQAD